MSPRPILKCQQESGTSLLTPNPFPFSSCSTANVLPSPHVHFPPTPSLAATHIAHSPTTYDRAPIVVSPNSCALPERGGRVYTPPVCQVKGSYFHPRAFEACEREPMDIPTAPFEPPPLVPDVSSSDSDDADGLSLTPPDTHAIPPISVHFSHNTSHPPIPRKNSQEEIDNALSFLPHPPSPVKDKERRKASPTRPRMRRGGSNLKHSSTFAAPSLDGCLGGF